MAGNSTLLTTDLIWAEASFQVLSMALDTSPDGAAYAATQKHSKPSSTSVPAIPAIFVLLSSGFPPSKSQNHPFNGWLDIAPIRGIVLAAPKGAVSPAMITGYPWKGLLSCFVFDDICFFLLLDILSNHIFINADGTHKISSCPQVSAAPLLHFWKAIKHHQCALPLRYPINSDTLNFGGIFTYICT